MNKLELKRDDFFPSLFASESLSISRLSATAFRFARFLWDTVEGGGEDRRSWTDIQWQDYLADPRCEFYAVFCDGEPAGCCELVRGPRLMRATGGSVRIRAFGLLPEYGGEGLGAILLTRMAEKGLATGAETISVQASQPFSEAMLTLLTRQGFR